MNLTGEQIYPQFWEAIYRVKRYELKVIGITFDKTSQNCWFLQLHCPAPSSHVLYKVKKPYTGKSEIFFSSERVNRHCPNPDLVNRFLTSLTDFQERVKVLKAKD